MESSGGRFLPHGNAASASAAPDFLDHTRCVIHIDINCFYAQVETVLNPALRGRPVGVRQKGLLVTCNYETRAYGVSKMNSIGEAMALCPELLIIDGSDLTNYRKASEDIFRLLRRYTRHIRKLGLDECFLDVTDLVTKQMRMDPTPEPEFVGHLYTNQEGPSRVCSCGCVQRLKTTSALAQEIRQALDEELGYLTCAGISVNKLLAKLAGDLHKPNQQTTLLPQDAGKFIASFPMHKLPGCGYRTSQRLSEIGIETAEELQRFPLAVLVERFGERTARILFRLCRGLDEEDGVKPTEAAKSMSEEDSFRHCVTRIDAETRLRGLVLQLLERVDERWDEVGDAPCTLRLSLRQSGAETYSNRISRQTFFPQISLGSSHGKPTNEDHRVQLLMLSVMELFDKLIEGDFDIELFNIAVADFKTTSQSGSVQPISKFFVAQAAPQNTSSSSHRAEASCVVTESRESTPQNDVLESDHPQFKRKRLADVQPSDSVPSYSFLEVDEPLLQCRQCMQRVRRDDAEAHHQFHKLARSS